MPSLFCKLAVIIDTMLLSIGRQRRGRVGSGICFLNQQKEIATGHNCSAALCRGQSVRIISISQQHRAVCGIVHFHSSNLSALTPPTHLFCDLAAAPLAVIEGRSGCAYQCVLNKRLGRVLVIVSSNQPPAAEYLELRLGNNRQESSCERRLKHLSLMQSE